ncbi:MAG: DUF4386 domain-containing protein [Bernardetiaceae bacterium]|jgi:hypothetical protein|nr:DUF4386 domain-containing protein [Bernardetiaceae bacterium]
MTNNNYFNAKVTGWLFIIAAISSIIGLKLYDPILNDDNFVLSASGSSSSITLGAICELILVATATGTGIMLFPLLKRYQETIGLAYLSFRILEVVFISIGIVSVLTALSISEQHTSGMIQSKDDAQNLMATFIYVHKWTFMIGPNFMLAINTFLYSYVLFRTKVIPIQLSRLGLVASFLIMTAAILELFGIIEQISTWGILLALPIALYEMTLAIWLIVKGIKTFPETLRHS